LKHLSKVSNRHTAPGTRYYAVRANTNIWRSGDSQERFGFGIRSREKINRIIREIGENSTKKPFG